MTNQQSRNRAWVEFILLPFLFLTVALLGGLRVSAEAGHAFVFLAPPLVTLVLALFLMLLFARGRLVDVRAWIASDEALLTNAAHVLTLAALFFASAQALNSVLPERGLLHWLFSFFFLWTLWNNLFSFFDARRLLRSLAVLFATAFVLKYMLLASLYAPESGLVRRLVSTLLEGVALGTLDTQTFAPATGYISFFTLVLYVASLAVISQLQGKTVEVAEASDLVSAYHQLSPLERSLVREAITQEPTGLLAKTVETFACTIGGFHSLR